jgi:serine/threonine-protein kinase
MADAALEPGRILAGKYRLGERLGEGGMGAVYRAEHLVLQAPVAIKVIEREVADEGTKARFMREAQAAAALRSPHVVQILDYGTEGDFPFMVMELLEGETLAQRIKRKKRLSPSETSWILTHVARAVAKAHELGIVHRDLKPDNVFLVHNEEDEIAKVLDFGVAKIEATSLTGDSHTRTGSLLGTPYYMSPEQAQGNKAIDHRSDLWALGVIAFECLTGKRPFASDGLGDLVLQICIRDLPVPSAVAPVPIGFDAWFERAMRREPDERFQSAKELADSLREALGAKDSPSVPELLVTTAPTSTPLPSSPTSATLDEDARVTAPETASVDAAAETVYEAVPEGTLGALRRAQATAASTGSSARVPYEPSLAQEDGQPALSVSLPGVMRAPAPRLPASEPPRRRSNAGLFLAVGAGALAVGVLTAVVALRDRPGFRVGDIAAPEPTHATRSAGTTPAQSRSTSDDGDGGRQPAQPRVQRSADADGQGTGGRVIDGRSILDPAPESGEGSGVESGGPEAAGKDGDGTAEPKANDVKGTGPQASDGKTVDGKPADARPTEPKPSDTKPGDGKPLEPKSGDPKPVEPKPTDVKPVDPKPVEPKSADPKPVEPTTTEPRAPEPQATTPEVEDALPAL